MQFSSAPSSSFSGGWQPCGAAYVAVYGTLRAGGVNELRRLLPGITCVGRTELQGTLYDLGAYPGLRLEGTQSVLVEVYPLDPALEQVVDGYEGIWPQNTGEYAKRVIPVSVAQPAGGTQTLAVLVYEVQPDAVTHAPVIAHSDWLAWFQTHKAPQNRK